jgi:translation initiation factor RLI1
VVTAPFGVREGINVFLAGYLPTENVRFRNYPLEFKVSESVQERKELEDDAARTRCVVVDYQYVDEERGDPQRCVQ